MTKIMLGRVALALALTLGALPGAQALVNVATQPDGSVVFNGGASGPFSETYAFGLGSGPYSLTLVQSPTVLQPWVSLGLLLQDGVPTAVNSLSAPGSFTFNAVAGAYQAIVSGTPGTPLSTFGVTIAPIPEPEIWAMMMVGLGLVGFQARRKARVPQPA